MDVVAPILEQRTAALALQKDTMLLRRALDGQMEQAAQLLELLQPADAPPPSLEQGKGGAIDLYA